MRLMLSQEEKAEYWRLAKLVVKDSIFSIEEKIEAIACERRPLTRPELSRLARLANARYQLRKAVANVQA